MLLTLKLFYVSLNIMSLKGDQTNSFFIPAQFLTLNISLIANSLFIYHSLPIGNAAVGKDAHFALLNEWNSTRTRTGTIFIQK